MRSSSLSNPAVFPDRHVTVGGIKVRYRSAGSGQPVLLLHGLGASLEHWEWTQPKLSERYEVVALDLPGFGESQTPPLDLFNLEFAVTLLGEFIEAIGWKSATVVGNSMGGLVAMSLALKLRERVSRLVLVDSAGLGRGLGWSLRLLTLPAVGEAILFSSRFRSLVRLSLSGLFSDPTRLPERLVDVTVRYYKSPKVRANLLYITRMGASIGGQRRTIDFRDQLGAIRAPTLVMWGRQDRLIPLSHGIVAHRLIAGSELSVVEDCGHFPQIEHPVIFADEVERFLEGTGDLMRVRQSGQP